MRATWSALLVNVVKGPVAIVTLDWLAELLQQIWDGQRTNGASGIVQDQEKPSLVG